MREQSSGENLKIVVTSLLNSNIFDRIIFALRYLFFALKKGARSEF